MHLLRLMQCRLVKTRGLPTFKFNLAGRHYRHRLHSRQFAVPARSATFGVYSVAFHFLFFLAVHRSDATLLKMVERGTDDAELHDGLELSYGLVVRDYVFVQGHQLEVPLRPAYLLRLRDCRLYSC